MYESAVLGAELQKFMTDKEINPLKNLTPIVFQVGVKFHIVHEVGVCF